MCQRHQLYFSESASGASEAASGGDFATTAAEAHYAPDLALDPEHLELDLRFDLATRTVAGTATTTVRARHEMARTLVLNAVGLTVHEVIDPDGRALSFTYDGEELTVTWGETAPLGELRRVEVRYEARNPLSGLMFSDSPAFIASDHETQRARYWIPCVDHPAVRTTLGVSLRGPASWHLLGPGLRQSETAHDDGTKTARWRLEQRCPAYLLCVSMGDYARLEGGVHRRADGSEVEIAFFAPKAEGHKLERTFGPTLAMMDWMVHKLGRPFPFPKYFQFSVPAIGGAMENISLVSWDDFCLMNERAQRDLRLRIDSINVHEMAHSYFGDAVVIRDYAHAWLKESWASYMESAWIEDVLGNHEAEFYRSEEVRDYRGEADGRYLRPIVTRHFDSAWDMFDMHLYPGGAARLHMLRRKVGDRAFWEGTRDYLTQFDGKTADTSDFPALPRGALRALAPALLRSVALRPGLSQAIKAGFSWDEASRKATVTLEQTQKDDKKRVGLFDLSVVIAFELDEGRWERRTVQLKDRAELELVCAARPKSVVIDPDGDLLFSLDWAPGNDLLIRALTAPTVTGRIQAVRALGKKAAAPAVAALESAMTSEPFWGVRVEICRALGEAGTDPAAQALSRLLMVEKDDRVRVHLARAAGGYRDAAIEQALVGFLDRDDVHATGGELAFAAALESLGKQRGEAHLDRLAKGALEAESWGWIQRGALAGLAQTRSEGALSPLIEATRIGRRRPVRIAAAENLGALGLWLAPAARARAVDRLVDMTRDADYGTRLAAVRGLAALGAHEAASAFEAAERMAAEQDVARIRRAARAAKGGDLGGGPNEKLVKRVEELEERLRKLEAKSG
jgi:aminopeptidase N